MPLSAFVIQWMGRTLVWQYLGQYLVCMKWHMHTVQSVIGERGFTFHCITPCDHCLIKKNSMVWVRERTIPTERPPLVGEVIANFCRILGFLCQLLPYSRFSRQELLLFYQVAAQLYSQGWVDPVPDPLLFFSGSARNRTRASGSVAKNSDHKTRGARSLSHTQENFAYEQTVHNDVRLSDHTGQQHQTQAHSLFNSILSDNLQIHLDFIILNYIFHSCHLVLSQLHTTNWWRKKKKGQ
jgi:hypothetical protein